MYLETANEKVQSSLNSTTRYNTTQVVIFGRIAGCFKLRRLYGIILGLFQAALFRLRAKISGNLESDYMTRLAELIQLRSFF